jgi:hypothetical protein
VSWLDSLFDTMEVSRRQQRASQNGHPKIHERIAKEHNCAPELVRAIVTDCLSAHHESTVKYGIKTALVGAYRGLGPLQLITSKEFLLKLPNAILVN